jgi:hypothetical protein
MFGFCSALFVNGGGPAKIEVSNRGEHLQGQTTVVDVYFFGYPTSETPFFLAVRPTARLNRFTFTSSNYACIHF